MMDNNMNNTDVKKTKNKGGSFYLLMGILTLVMAIAGSTYAYFAVSTTSKGNEITGTSAYGDAALTIEISQISTGTGKLVPQLGSAIQLLILVLVERLVLMVMVILFVKHIQLKLLIIVMLN